MTNMAHALDLLSQYSSEESGCEEDSSESSKASNRSPENSIFSKGRVPESFPVVSQEKVPRMLQDYERLPVPEVLSKLFNDEKNLNSHVDDPALHDGRVRSFPHVRGNWSTFVYIPYECNQSLRLAFNLAVEVCGTAVNLKPIEQPHISLTRTVALQHHWIDILIHDIKESFHQIKRFPISFSSFDVYCNDERTRTFLSLQLSEGRAELVNCVELMNKCLSAFKLPSFYKDASFHLSVAWCTGDKSEDLKSELTNLNSKLQNLTVEEPDQFETIVGKVECKVGNKLFRFDLC